MPISVKETSKHLAHSLADPLQEAAKAAFRRANVPSIRMHRLRSGEWRITDSLEALVLLSVRDILAQSHSEKVTTREVIDRIFGQMHGIFPMDREVNFIWHVQSKMQRLSWKRGLPTKRKFPLKRVGADARTFGYAISQEGARMLHDRHEVKRLDGVAETYRELVRHYRDSLTHF